MLFKPLVKSPQNSASFTVFLIPLNQSLRTISFIYLVTCLFPNQLFSQATSRDFEIPLVEDQMVERIVVLDSSIVVSQVEAFTKADYIPTRRYRLLNHDLILQIDSVVEIPFRNKRTTHFTNASFFHEFYYDYKKGNYSLVKIGNEMLEIEQGRLPSKMYEPKLVISDEAKFILDRRMNRERVVVIKNDSEKIVSTSVSKIKKRTKVFPLFFSVIDNSENVGYIWREKSLRVDDVRAVIWNNDGTLLQRLNLQLPGKTIHSAFIRQIDEDRYMITGTYSQFQTNMASGAFMALIEDGAILQHNLYSFSELPHYFDYLDKYEKEEMSRKLARLKKHEKSTEIRTHVVVHKVDRVGETFLLPIEFYNESFKDQYGITRNGNTIAGSPQTLKGYDYSHAVILRFDLDGQLKHDYFFDIELDYLAKKNDAKMQTVVIADTLLVGYAAKNNMYFGNIKPVEFARLEKESSVKDEPDSVIRKEAQFSYLPDGRVLIYGFKTTKSNKGLNKKEDIYFIETRKVR